MTQNHKNFKCFISIHVETENNILGEVVAIEIDEIEEIEYRIHHIGDISCFLKEYGRIATEEDIKKMNKLVVFQ